MIVEDNRDNPLVFICDIEIGECFMTRGHVYIRADKSISRNQSDVSAVRLDTGYLISFDSNDKVTPVNVKASIIKD